MRGNQDFQGAMFSYISLEERVPQAHPLRKLRAVVDALLATMNREFEAVYARRGRPSVPPEMLLKALLLQILFSIRSERQLVEAVNYNLLYRWFMGLNIEDRSGITPPSAPTANACSMKTWRAPSSSASSSAPSGAGSPATNTSVWTAR